MSTHEIHDPMRYALLRLYSKHRRLMYLDYMQNFKLFANWLSDTFEYSVFDNMYPAVFVPWYHRSYELAELAKILKCSEREVLGMLEEIHDDT